MTKEPQRQSTDEKLEIAKRIASQSQRMVKTYASVELSVLRVIRWLSAWVDKLLFNPRFGKPISLALALLLFATINFGNADIFSSGISGSGEEIPDIPLTVIANNEVYEITGLPNTVNALLVGELADIQMTKNQGGYKVVADLTGLTEGVHQINLVATDFSPRVAVAVTPSTAIVTVTRKVSAKFILDYDFVNVNKMDLEYVLGEPQLELSEIIVRASQSTLDSIAFVKAFIDVTGVTGNFTKKVPIVAYDQLGNRVKADIMPSEVSVTVNVTSPSKTVPVIVDPVGEIPNGKAISSITMDHNSITLFAPESVLAKIDELRIPINATTLTGDTNLVYTVTLPSGVRELSVTKVNMEIRLGDGVKRIVENVMIRYRNNIKGYRFTIVDPEDAYTNVELFGTAENIANITEDNMEVYIDMLNIELGLQSVIVYVDGGTTLVKFTPEKPTISIEVIR